MNWNQAANEEWRAYLGDTLVLIVERNYTNQLFDASVYDLQGSRITATQQHADKEAAQYAALLLAKDILREQLQTVRDAIEEARRRPEFEAGEELNLIVARAMGYRIEGDSTEGYWLHDGANGTILPDFSDDISAAWEIVTHMHAHTMQLSWIATEAPFWGCSFGDWDNAYADTAPLAICRAFLLAMARAGGEGEGEKQ